MSKLTISREGLTILNYLSEIIKKTYYEMALGKTNYWTDFHYCKDSAVVKCRNSYGDLILLCRERTSR